LLGFKRRINEYPGNTNIFIQKKLHSVELSVNRISALICNLAIFLFGG